MDTEVKPPSAAKPADPTPASAKPDEPQTAAKLGNSVNELPRDEKEEMPVIFDGKKQQKEY